MYTCMYVLMCFHVYMCAHTSEGYRLTSGVLPEEILTLFVETPTLFVETGSFTGT